jgi:hypothetical protein
MTRFTLDQLRGGTILRTNGTLQLYASPDRWHSPSDGLAAQPDRWMWVGVEGWYYSAEIKALHLELRTVLGSYPSYPGEWDLIPVETPKHLETGD